MKIMFVCTGNICRSAMAQWLMKKKLEDANREDIQVFSCGIFAYDKDMASQEAIEVMQEYGVDLKQHEATNIQKSKIQQMDYVFCMTNSQKYTVLNQYPELAGRVYTLKEFATPDAQDLEIKDPWGYTIAVYRVCAAEIDSCLDKVIEKLPKQ